MPTPDGRLTIVFNGEIYNYRELRDELIAQGVAFVSDSDTEVMLHLYARDGAAMLGKLRGMFALAIWDARDARAVARARPARHQAALLSPIPAARCRFASQVKALLADPAISRDPSPAGLAGFHLLGSVPEPFTAWRAIRRCPPAATMTVDAARRRRPPSATPMSRDVWPTRRARPTPRDASRSPPRCATASRTTSSPMSRSARSCRPGSIPAR